MKNSFSPKEIKQHSSEEHNVELIAWQRKTPGKRHAENHYYPHTKRRNVDLRKLKTSLKYDRNLQLGRSNFQDIIKSLKRKQDDNQQTNIPPSPYELAQLTINVGIKKKKHETDDDYEKKLNLPLGWKLLTTAWTGDLTNGYFGAAFFNSEKNMVVVAHQATRNFGSWFTNWCILFDIRSSRINSAATFVDHVINALEEVPGVGLSFTGHSLGGYLAQISCFTAKYLKGHNSNFIKNPSEGIQAHAVSFDNPGSQTMLRLLEKSCKVPKESYKTLDITNYLSVPNVINTHDTHVGEIYRVFPDFSRKVDVDLSSPRIALYKLTREVHLMLHIAPVFKEENWRLKVKRETEWPHTFLFNISKKTAIELLEQHYRFFLESSNIQ